MLQPGPPPPPPWVRYWTNGQISMCLCLKHHATKACNGSGKVVLSYSISGTRWSRVCFEILLLAKPIKKFHAFCWTRKLIIIVTRACHWPPSWATGIQCALNFTIPDVPCRLTKYNLCFWRGQYNKNFLLIPDLSFLQDYIHKVPIILRSNLQRECPEPYGPPTSVTWMHLLRKQANNGIFTALIAKTRWSTRTRLRALSLLVTFA